MFQTHHCMKDCKHEIKTKLKNNNKFKRNVFITCQTIISYMLQFYLWYSSPFTLNISTGSPWKVFFNQRLKASIGILCWNIKVGLPAFKKMQTADNSHPTESPNSLESFNGHRHDLESSSMWQTIGQLQWFYMSLHLIYCRLYWTGKWYSTYLFL